jgi:putative aminopeptidase FrvX
MDMYKILKEYTEIPGPVGHEKRVQKRFMKDLAPYTDEIELTNVGNVLAHIPGEGRKVVILMSASSISAREGPVTSGTLTIWWVRKPSS